MSEPLTRAIEKQIQQAPIEQKAKLLTQQNLWPELLTAKDILQLPPDPTRWIWDECLPAGGTSLLVAKPKVGKSTFAVALALAVARGMPFLTRPTQQAAVAYLSLDAILVEIAEAFCRIGLRESDPVFIHAGAAPRDAIAWIMHRVQQNGVKFVVIDTLQRLFRFQNVNDYSEVTNAMEPLMEQARQQNCHVLFVHHAKKDALDDLDSGIGSTALRGLAQTYLHLKRLPDSERRIFRTDQRNGRNFEELCLRFDPTGWLEVMGNREKAEIEDCKPKIQDFLQAEGREMLEKEIRAGLAVKGIVASKALREMFKANEIERTGNGGRGDPFRYSLAGSLLETIPNKPAVIISIPSYKGVESTPSGNRIAKSELTSCPSRGNTIPKTPENSMGTTGNGNRMGIASGIELKNPDFFSQPTPLVDKILAEIALSKKQ